MRWARGSLASSATLQIPESLFRLWSRNALETRGNTTNSIWLTTCTAKSKNCDQHYIVAAIAKRAFAVSETA